MQNIATHPGMALKDVSGLTKFTANGDVRPPQSPKTRHSHPPHDTDSPSEYPQTTRIEESNTIAAIPGCLSYLVTVHTAILCVALTGQRTSPAACSEGVALGYGVKALRADRSGRLVMERHSGFLAPTPGEISRRDRTAQAKGRRSGCSPIGKGGRREPN